MSDGKRIDAISTMIIFERHVPAPPLNNFIESFIYFKGYQPEHTIERKVPDGLINLIFELDGIERTVYENETRAVRDKFTSVWISGMHSKYITFSAHPDSEMFVISFKPGGGYPFLHSPVNNLTDKIIDAGDIFGTPIIDFRERLLAAADFKTKFQLAENRLIERANFSLAPETVIREAVDCIINNSNANLAELVKQSRYSRKQFIHLFKKHVGIPPKLFQRIMRFNEILQKVENKAFISWAQISAECGYFDQAHFIRDFKAFSGYNPGEFLKAHLASERINFFPLD